MNKSFSRIYFTVFCLIVLILFFRGFTVLLAEWHFEKGKQFELGDTPSLALKEYESSLILNPNPDYYQKLGAIFYLKAVVAETESQKEIYFKKALEFTQKAIDSNPKRSIYYHLRGAIYLINQELGLAERDFQTAIELDTFNHLEFYIDLASLYLNIKDYDRADEVVSSILAKYSEEIIQYLKRQEKEVASQLAIEEGRVDFGPLRKVAKLYELKGMISLKKGNVEEARGFFKKSTEIRSL